MDWTSIEQLPSDVSKYFSIEREDDKISSLVLNLPDCKPLRIVGHDYSKAVKLQGPRPPKDIEIFAVSRDDGELLFKCEKRAKNLAEALSTSVSSRTVSEADIPSLPIADRDNEDSDSNDFLF